MHRIAALLAALLIASGVALAQVGRGWSDWPTPYADAQRTSWLRSDPNISVESLAKPGFDLQWTSRLENQRRGLHGLTQGVTASGVTLFVPTSLVAGSSNTLHMLDNDTGHVVWSRTFDSVLAATTTPCSGGHQCGADPDCERGSCTNFRRNAGRGGWRSSQPRLP